MSTNSHECIQSVMETLPLWFAGVRLSPSSCPRRPAAEETNTSCQAATKGQRDNDINLLQHQSHKGRRITSQLAPHSPW